MDLRDLGSDIALVKKKISQLHRQLIAARAELKTLIDQERAPKMRQVLRDFPDSEEEDLLVGPHECKASPLGECVYDALNAGYEACLYCGDPEERK